MGLKKPDQHGNVVAREGLDRCDCGSKYWENDRCIDCGARPVRLSFIADLRAVRGVFA